MWTKNDMPNQGGKTALITGSNTGIGYETALALYQAGAHVIVACRDIEKAEAAIYRMKAEGGRGSLETSVLNLANLGAIQAFADEVKRGHQQLHILINNAGVMLPPASLTDDGFEWQFGVNFIGHFALTGHLYPLVNQTPQSRVVTVSSGASTYVDQIDFGNLRLEKPYDAMREYAVSKLANAQFAFELARRARVYGDLLSLAVHPGVVYTDLQRHIPQDQVASAFAPFNVVSQPWQGALPSLFAATSPAATGGGYYGPDGEGELTGYPAPSQLITPAMTDPAQASKLWQYAQTVTGLQFPY